MTDVKKMLIEEWMKEKEILDSLDVINDGDAYERQLKRVADLEKHIVDLDINQTDNNVKYAMSDDENKRSKWKFAGELAKATIPVIGACAMGLVSMKWEKLDTLTSTAGKASLRDALKFK